MPKTKTPTTPPKTTPPPAVPPTPQPTVTSIAEQLVREHLLGWNSFYGLTTGKADGLVTDADTAGRALAALVLGADAVPAETCPASWVGGAEVGYQTGLAVARWCVAQGMNIPGTVKP